MALTERAAVFLQRQKRRADAVNSQDTIERAFRQAGRKLTPALLDFQVRYGGLMIYAGLEPICFGILHGRLARGEFKTEKKYHSLITSEPDEDCSYWCFTCADTLYQEDFMLDEQGGYYEGGQLHASCFDAVIEDLAMFKQVHEAGYQKQYQRYAEDLALPADTLAAALQVESESSFPPNVVFWGQNDQYVVRRSVDELMIFAAEPLSSSVLATCDELLLTHSTKPQLTASVATLKPQAPSPVSTPSLLMRLIRWLDPRQ